VFYPAASNVLDSRGLQVIASNKTNSDRRGGGRFAVAIFAALTAAPAAFAADMPSPAPVYAKAPVPVANDWTGFYLGAGLGSRSANVSEQTLSAAIQSTNAAQSFNAMAPNQCLALLCGATQALDHTAFRFSPYFGYNWQIGPQWLVGLEGDVGFGSKTSTINGVPLPSAGFLDLNNLQGDSFAIKTGWDASARARVGYLVTPDLLVYATGGAAWQHIEATSTIGPFNQFSGFIANSITDARTAHGYTVGGGIETMVWGHWLLRGEFRYSDFGTITNTDVRTEPTLNNNTFTTNYKLHLTTETALVGVAYKF
jgi:outer membrane immunogenic protein